MIKTRDAKCGMIVRTEDGRIGLLFNFNWENRKAAVQFVNEEDKSIFTEGISLDDLTRVKNGTKIISG